MDRRMLIILFALGISHAEPRIISPDQARDLVRAAIPAGEPRRYGVSIKRTFESENLPGYYYFFVRRSNPGHHGHLVGRRS